MDTIDNGVHHPNLLALPNEVILMILENSTLFTEVLFMGLQCRRLNSLALPLFLNRHGITDPLNNLHVILPSPDTRLLEGLCVAFQITHTTNLSCTFTHSRSILDLFERIKDFSHFVSRLRYVRHVTLTFQHTTGDRLRILKDWCSVFGRLLTTLVLKGCISLSIVGGDMFLGRYQLLPPPPVSKSLHLLRRVIKLVKPSHSPDSQGWEVVPRRPGEMHFLPLFPVQPSFHSNLTTITLRKSLLSLIPPYSTWTFSALMASPVTALSLLDISTPMSPVWPAILPLLAKSLPKLQHLAILRSVAIPQFSVNEVLERFPNLQTFLYDGRSDPFSSLSILPPLSHLRKLYARSDIIINTLSSPNANLSNLTMIGTHILTRSKGFNLAEGASAMSDIVNALRKHLPASSFLLPEPQTSAGPRRRASLPFKILLNVRQNSHSTYLLEQELSILPFLTSTSPSSTSPISPTPTSSTTSKFRSPFASRSRRRSESAASPASTQKLMENLKSFHYVSGVSLDTFSPNITRDDDWEVLIRWLRLFPNVEEVRLGKGAFGWIDELDVEMPIVGGSGDDDTGTVAGADDETRRDMYNLNDELVKDLRSPSQQSGSPQFLYAMENIPRPSFGSAEDDASIWTRTSNYSRSVVGPSAARGDWEHVRLLFEDGCPTVQRIVLNGDVVMLGVGVEGVM